jgi:hypothetical protein
VTLKTTELMAASVSTTTTTTTSGSSNVPSVEALCKVLGQRAAAAAAKDDDDHVRSVVQCGDGLEDELGAKVLRGRRRQEVTLGKKWTLHATPAAIHEKDYSSGDSSSYFEEMMKVSARRQSKWKEQFHKLANKTRRKKPLLEEEREECVEKMKKPLEKKLKQIRRNSTSTFSTQLPVETLEKKKKQPPRRHSLFIQRVSDLLQDETGVAEVFNPRIPLNPSPPPTKGAGDKLDEIRQIKQLESISTLLQESLWSDRVEGLEKLAELSSSSLSLSEPAVFSALSKVVHLATNGCLRNIRTALSRQATSTFREMFVGLGPGMDVFLERGLADGLLSKMMDTNAFIKKEVQEALEAMVQSCSPTRVGIILENVGSKHRNSLVRLETVRLLGMFIRHVSPTATLQLHPERVLPMLLRFLDEPSTRIRELGKKALLQLLFLPAFDSTLQRVVEVDSIHKARPKLERIKCN